MSKTTLNKANLEKLGAETLAALVMELVQGSAALKRRARMELAAAQGPEEVAADIRKRMASLRRATSWIDWQKQRALVKDLTGLLSMIAGSIAPEDPDGAFELLWSFLQLAPSIHARTDDGNGALGEVLGGAVEMIEALAPRLSADPETLAERILDAVAAADFGEFDGIIPALSGALGPTGLAHLKEIATAWQAAPPDRADLERYRSYGLSSPADTGGDLAAAPRGRSRAGRARTGRSRRPQRRLRALRTGARSRRTLLRPPACEAIRPVIVHNLRRGPYLIAPPDCPP
ncbi:DUF6880 family protein [Mangrovicoccus ximenensis]|uniref:DUF6880 family protein n=1 Tax=Mangrovicoccus ximenensis TaxID=1911570 RepID=UPI000D345603|nr:DUF6880 family protein [Mangrovicoccus ximenensis]